MNRFRCLLVLLVLGLSACGGGPGGETGGATATGGGLEDVPGVVCVEYENVFRLDAEGFTRADIAYVKGGQLYLYDSETDRRYRLVEEQGTVVSCTFTGDGREVGYTVLHDGELWLKSLSGVADAPPQLSRGMPLGLAYAPGRFGERMCRLLHMRDGRFAAVIYELQPDTMAVTACSVYEPNGGQVDTLSPGEARPMLEAESTTHGWFRLGGVGADSVAFHSEGGGLRHVGRCLSCDLPLANTSEGLAGPVFGPLMVSPDSTRVLFGARLAAGGGSWCVANLDGTGQRVLTEAGDISHPLRPAWLGNRLVFLERSVEVSRGMDARGVDSFLCISREEGERPFAVDHEVSDWCIRR